MRNYSDKTVYLGIDVHKKTYAVTAICEGQVVKRDTLAADPLTLVSYCKKCFFGATIESAYEAGFSGFHLHRQLEAHGIKNRVIHAAGMEVAVGDRVKTDKRDSLKLATQLAAKRLEGIYVPSEEREGYRALTRLRDTFVREKVRLGSQLKALLFQHGLIRYMHEQRTSEKWIKSLEKMEMGADIRYAVDHYRALWRHIVSKIKEIEEEMVDQAEKDKFLEDVYRSVPGIGPIAARVLANELGDLSQFKNEEQVFSYVGLTPSEHSSGGHIRQGHISRQGKPLLRKILTQASWVAIKSDPNLGEIYERIRVKAGGKRAIVGIARRLVGRIRACFRTGRPYEMGRAEPQLAMRSNGEVFIKTS